MKLKLFFLFLFWITFVCKDYAQTKIGKNPNIINISSLLELESDSLGVLLPRINLTDYNKWSPLQGGSVDGMIVFNNSSVLPKGLYYWSNSDAKWIQLISSSNNGISLTDGNLQLGGSLIKPTTIITSNSNSLSLKGLQTGNATADSCLVVEASTGIIKKISGAGLSTTSYKSITSAIDGQAQFLTPAPIIDEKKIQVYRNGINVEFTKLDSNNIQLVSDARCYAGDEVKIIQLK